MIIGGEGALLMGAFAATSTALLLQGAPALVVQMAIALAGMTVGGAWIALSGSLQHYPGVNEDISSLLLALYRARAAQSSGRGADARSGEPEQAFDERDRRRRH